MNTGTPLDQARALLEMLTASDVADLFLSPHMNPEQLRQLTVEPGPTLWIVNRSDVYDETLEALSTHPLNEIAGRAREKLQQRRSLLTTLVPPTPLETPLEETPSHLVEDILGHPLAPFEAMLYFARSLEEDHRASAALSLTRRLVEHPPRWLTGDPTQTLLEECFGNLLTADPSPYVRAYAARIPVIPASRLLQALKLEENAFVWGRLLQNPALSEELLEEATRLWRDRPFLHKDSFASRILALDARLKNSERKGMSQHPDPLTRLLSSAFQEQLATA